MYKTAQKPHMRSNQQGMVAIVTTIILTIVISLIVLGFSQITRRNARQVLDAQLSSQAFYAAESGLNLAKAKLGEGGQATTDYTDKVDCSDPSFGADYRINNETQITCVLTHLPDHLLFDDVDSTSKVSLIKKQDGTLINNLTITWQNATSSAAPSGCSGTVLYPAGSWGCNQPLLRIDLVPVSDTNNDRNTLIASQYTAFFYPTSNGGGGSTTAWGSSMGSNKGNLIQTACSSGSIPAIDRKCKITVTGMLASQYAIRIMSLYGTSEVIIYGSGTPRPTLVGGQVVVDSTARSLDVVKRIRARVPIGGSGAIPDFAIDSGDGICKGYKITGGNVGIESGTEYAGCGL